MATYIKGKQSVISNQKQNILGNFGLIFVFMICREFSIISSFDLDDD